MSDEDRCVRAAEECERMARRTTVAEDRNALLNMAQLWRELAQSSVAAEWIELQAPAPRAGRHS